MEAVLQKLCLSSSSRFSSLPSSLLLTVTLILFILNCHWANTANRYVTTPQRIFICSLARTLQQQTVIILISRTRRPVSKSRQKQTGVLSRKKWKEQLEWKTQSEKCFEGEPQMREQMRKTSSRGCGNELQIVVMLERRVVKGIRDKEIKNNQHI